MLKNVLISQREKKYRLFFFSTEAVTICTGHRAAELKPVVLKGLTDMGFQPYPHI